MKGVLLDRDGTLVDVVRDEETGTVHTAFHPSQLRLLPGVVEGLRALADAGYVLAIATNQPGPAKGQVSIEAVTRTNDALVELLASQGVTLTKVACCVHHPEGGPGGARALIGPCACRKPAPGMLLELVRELRLRPEATWMVGDSRTDIAAGDAAGLRTALVLPAGRCELCPLRGQPMGLGARPTAVAGSLVEVARAILTAEALAP